MDEYGEEIIGEGSTKKGKVVFNLSMNTVAYSNPIEWLISKIIYRILELFYL